MFQSLEVTVVRSMDWNPIEALVSHCGEVYIFNKWYVCNGNSNGNDKDKWHSYEVSSKNLINHTYI